MEGDVDFFGSGGDWGCPYSESFSWSYNNDDTPASESLPNGTTVSMTYNALKQLTALQNAVGSTVISKFNSMSYDGAGNLKQYTETNNAATAYSGTTSFTYDSTGQLTQEASTRLGGYTNNFAYDAAGNPTTLRGGTVAFTSKNQVSGTTYDSDGNPASYAGNSLSYDNLSRLASFGSTMTAGYGNDNLRDWKSAGGTQTYYVYDGLVPVLELNSSGTVTAVTTALGNTPLTRHDSSGSVFYTYDPMGGLVQRLDSSSNVLTSHAFDALGASSSTGTTSDPYANFKAAAGYRTDPETGLLLAGQRYYDTNGGRFLTRDPIGQGGGSNMYAHCLNNPLRLGDPTGLCPEGSGIWFDTEGDYWSAKFSSFHQSSVGQCYAFLGRALRPLNPAGADPVALVEGILTLPQRVGHLGEASGSEGLPGFIKDGETVLEVVGLATGGMSVSGLGAGALGEDSLVGQNVYRVFGDGSGSMGQSWTRVDPSTVADFRNEAGLPNENSGRFVIQGVIQDSTGITTRAALELDGNIGGIDEVMIPNANSQVRITRVSGVNPEF